MIWPPRRPASTTAAVCASRGLSTVLRDDWFATGAGAHDP